MRYPNKSSWAALDDGLFVVQDEKNSLLLSVVDRGIVNMPSGKLVVCDPFAGLVKHDNLYGFPPQKWRAFSYATRLLASNLRGDL